MTRKTKPLDGQERPGVRAKSATAATREKPPVYTAMVRCPCCGDPRMLETLDENLLFNPPRCFTCYMNNRPIPEIIGPKNDT